MQENKATLTNLCHTEQVLCGGCGGDGGDVGGDGGGGDVGDGDGEVRDGEVSKMHNRQTR